MRGRNVPTARHARPRARVGGTRLARAWGRCRARFVLPCWGFRQMMFTETAVPGVCIMEPQDSMVGAHRSEPLMTCG